MWLEIVKQPIWGRNRPTQRDAGTLSAVRVLDILFFERSIKMVRILADRAEPETQFEFEFKFQFSSFGASCSGFTETETEARN
jgi:hypothetical protein